MSGIKEAKSGMKICHESRKSPKFLFRGYYHHHYDDDEYYFFSKPYRVIENIEADDCQNCLHLTK